VITSQKGTRDLLPPETRVWNGVERTAREVFGRYGYDEIRTPTFEATELFVRSVGESTDIVHKEMYSFTDRGGRSVTLRPENTAGVARAFVEHGLAQAGGIHRLYYIGPQFRYERPQKGRFREFRQIGAEVLGASDAATDAEVIVMLFDFLVRLGFAGLSVALNSVGTEEERPGFIQALRAWFSSKEGMLDADDTRRLDENPLRILDSKNPKLAEWLADSSLPRMIDFLSKDSSRHHEELLALLDARAIPYRVEPRLVRGLDYYTRTVFEVTAAGLGAQDALLGGGRYDRLVSDLGGPKTPGIGFAIGEDRLIDVLPPATREAFLGEGASQVAVVPIGPEDVSESFALAAELRRSGVRTELDSSAKGPGRAIKSALRRGIGVVVLLGEDERRKGTFVVKDLAAEVQSEHPRERLVAEVAALLRPARPT
jgi:histidyl-tRNA synthetase